MNRFLRLSSSLALCALLAVPAAAGAARDDFDLSASGISPNRYQSSENWYKDQEGQKTYFLMLTESEYATFKTTDIYKEMLAYQALLSTFQSGDYYILVFSQNLL